MREMRREHQQLIEIMSAAVGVDISQGKPRPIVPIKDGRSADVSPLGVEGSRDVIPFCATRPFSIFL